MLIRRVSVRFRKAVGNDLNSWGSFCFSDAGREVDEVCLEPLQLVSLVNPLENGDHITLDTLRCFFIANYQSRDANRLKPETRSVSAHAQIEIMRPPNLHGPKAWNAQYVDQVLLRPTSPRAPVGFSLAFELILALVRVVGYRLDYHSGFSD